MPLSPLFFEGAQNLQIKTHTPVSPWARAAVAFSMRWRRSILRLREESAYLIDAILGPAWPLYFAAGPTNPVSLAQADRPWIHNDCY